MAVRHLPGDQSLAAAALVLLRPPPPMYAKVFRQIFESSIAEDPELRFTFMDLLVLADSDGVVDMTHESISRVTNRPLEVIKKTISQLEGPDPRSRTPTADGARIKRLDDHRDWGWMIINYDSFRSMATEEQKKERTRERVKRYRQKVRNQPVTSNVTLCNADVTPPSVSVYVSVPQEGGTGETGPSVILELSKRLSTLYHRKPSDRMNYEEECLLAQVVRREDPIGELNEIEAYFKRCDRKYFPHSLSSLLEKWNVTLDASRRPPDRTPDEQKAIARADASWVPPIPKSMRYEDPN